MKGARAARGVRRLMLGLARQEIHHRRVFARTLNARFTELGDRAAASFREVKQPDEVTVTQIMLLLNASAWRDTILRGDFVRHYARVLTSTGDLVESVLQLGVMLPDPLQRVILDAGGRRAGLLDIDGQTRAALYRSLADGREAGEGPAKLAQRIRGEVAAGPYTTAGARYRAILIARTETKYAQNVSTVATYREADGITGCIAYDNRTGFGDADCTARDGQFFTFDEATAETDAEHPNGTLSFGPATGGE